MATRVLISGAGIAGLSNLRSQGFRRVAGNPRGIQRAEIDVLDPRFDRPPTGAITLERVHSAKTARGGATQGARAGGWGKPKKLIPSCNARPGMAS